MDRCSKHPNYRGLRRPWAKVPCEECLALYEAVQAQGVKEDRAPYTKRAKGADVVVPPAVVAPDVVEADVVEEEAEEDCFGCNDEETFDDVLNQFDADEVEEDDEL